MEDNHHHDKIILHDFEDLFLWKKSTNDECSKLFNFISTAVSTCVLHVLEDEPNPISIRTLKDFLHESKPMIMGSWCTYIVGWWKSTNRLALIITWSEMIITLKVRWRNTTRSLMKIIEANQDFKITFFPKQSSHTIAWLTVQQGFLIC